MKTNFEIARIYSNGQFNHEKHELDKPNFYCIHLHEAFEAGIEHAQRFIPLSEELPDPHTNILIIDSISNSESYGQFSLNMEWFHCHKSTNVFAKSDIVSWRPLYF